MRKAYRLCISARSFISASTAAIRSAEDGWGRPSPKKDMLDEDRSIELGRKFFLVMKVLRGGKKREIGPSTDRRRLFAFNVQVWSVRSGEVGSCDWVDPQVCPLLQNLPSPFLNLGRDVLTKMYPSPSRARCRG